MSEGLDTAVRVLAVLAGPALGSFAALLADRLPRGEPVVLTRSRCRECGATLRAREMIPLVSWLWLRGRCARCGAPVPAWLWQAEVLGLGCGVAAAVLGAGPAQVLLGVLVLCCLLALALADLGHFRLPDPLTLGLGALALALAAAGDGSGWPPLPDRLAEAALGAVAGGGAFWALRVGYRALAGREGLGMGDVKLMAGLGALVGLWALPMVTLLAGVAALASAALRALRRGRRLRGAQRLPFGAYLALSGGVVWLWLQLQGPI